MTLPRPRAALLLAATLVGCQAAPHEPPHHSQLDPLHAPQPITVPAALEVAPHESAPVTVGQSAVYSLQLHKTDAVKTWFLRLTIVNHRPEQTGTLWQKPPSGEMFRFDLRGTVRFAVEVTDAAGRPVETAHTSWLFTEQLDGALAEGCRLSLRLRTAQPPTFWMFETLPKADQRRIVLATWAVKAFIKIAEQNTALAPLLESVVRKPSVVQVLANLGTGVRAVFAADGARRWSAATPIAVGEAFVAPLEVRAFRQPALDGSVVVGRGPALLACAGVLSLAGRHPDDPDTHVRLQLQALGRVSPQQLAKLQADAN